MPPKSDQFDHLLHLALASPWGKVITTHDPDRLRMVLYSARVRLNVPEMARLQFKLSSNPAFGPSPVLVILKTGEGKALRAGRKNTPLGPSASPEARVASFLPLD